MNRYFTREPVLHETEAVELLREKSHRLTTTRDLDTLMERIGDARIVMLGEASHGTHEYYLWRARLTRRLIEEKGFNFVAVEGEWPDCYRLNRYVKNYPSSGESAYDVLHKFNRWPTWMWANWEVAAFADMLFKHNKPLSKNKKVGFYGLDVYSLWESMESIMQYLKKNDTKALILAEEAFHCFEPYRYDEGKAYARASQFVPELCENEVVTLLRQIQKKLPQYNTDHENVFSAEQNAIVTVNAEKYYRAMINGGPHSWNLRDRHMADTLERLMEFHGEKSKSIVWAHNTHIGDARATDMANEGMFNIGELTRMQHHEKGVVLVGFGSYEGTVIAAKSWDAPTRKVDVPAARKGSWEYLLHRASLQDKLLLTDDLMTDPFLENHVGHRAIGVVYNPAYEQYGNYVPTIIPMRYDAFIYFETTKALHPLHIKPNGHQLPETYPFGV